MNQNTFTIAPDGKSITCLVCGRTSYNLNDVARKYCGNCHKFHEELAPILSCPPAEKAKQLEMGIVDYEPCPGAELATCQSCETPVHIGPRLRQMRQKFSGCTVLCHKCAILATGGKPNTINLGGIGAKYLTK